MSDSSGARKPMKIIGFLCNWCCYAGADLAGVSRIQYPPDMKVIRVMCSTRIDPVFLFQAFRQGADGIFIGGCHPGDCHYLTGNYHTLNKINATRRVLGMTGIDPNRLHLEWVSAAEGERFASEVSGFIGKCRELGPSELVAAREGSRAKDSEDKNQKKPAEKEPGNPEEWRRIDNSLRAAEYAFSGFRLRSVVGRQKKIEDGDNVYGEVITPERWDNFLTDMVDTEFLRGRIMVELDSTPASVKDISAALDEDAARILKEVNLLRKRGIVRLDRVDDRTPIYASEVSI